MNQAICVESKTKVLPYLMWLLPLSFFAYQFLLRLWPGLMMQEIMQQFSIDAASFGLLAAFYYYGYAGMQIPMAILLDNYGPRTIIFIFATLCGLSFLLFIFTTNFYLALVSRFLIGACSAVGFLGTSAVVSKWFSNTSYSRMIGLSFSFGLLGAVYGGRPLAILVADFGWQPIALALGILAIFIGLSSYLFLANNKQSGETSKITLSQSSVLFSSWQLWALALANLLMVGSLEGFADVWGIPYLTTCYGFAKADAALLISFIFLGMLFGGPFLAYFAKKFGNYKVLRYCGLGLSLCFVIMLSFEISSWWLCAALDFIIGLLCCYQVIIFAAGSNLVPSQYLGLTIAFLNCINMLGGSFFHTLIGKIMDFYWQGELTAEGLRSYSLQSFQHALALIPISAIVAVLLIVFLNNGQTKAKIK